MSNLNSFIALTNFIDANDIETDAYGNCHFQAIVQYTSSLFNDITMTSVKFIRNGYDDGRITLDENQKLPQDKCHIDFTPDFQEYEFNAITKKLLVKGKSVKMGGNYLVELTYQ